MELEPDVGVAHPVEPTAAVRFETGPWIIPVMEGVAITRGSAADIPRLEPLWVAVHHQHVASMPELAPVRLRRRDVA